VSCSRNNRFVSAARLLAGVLVGLMLVFELLAADGKFHQTFHHGGNAATNSCVLCLFAKGQVDSPPLAPSAPACVWSVFHRSLRMEFSAPSDSLYLISASRAPPAVPFVFPVVA